METDTRIIIADDHPIFRRGLSAVIEMEAGMHVVAEAEDGTTAIAQINALEPDVAILDLNMPGHDGFEVARVILESEMHTAIIILTMHDSETLFNAAMDLGVNGFVLKDSAMPEIIDCIESVVSGKRYISPQLSTYLINRGQRVRDLIRESPSLRDLTAAEQHILRAISLEKSSRQIAEELSISIRTVDRHRSNICLKLNLRGSNALMKFALVHKTEL